MKIKSVVQYELLEDILFEHKSLPPPCATKKNLHIFFIDNHLTSIAQLEKKYPLNSFNTLFTFIFIIYIFIYTYLFTL